MTEQEGATLVPRFVGTLLLAVVMVACAQAVPVRTPRIRFESAIPSAAGIVMAATASPLPTRAAPRPADARTPDPPPTATPDSRPSPTRLTALTASERWWRGYRAVSAAPSGATISRQRAVDAALELFWPREPPPDLVLEPFLAVLKDQRSSGRARPLANRRVWLVRISNFVREGARPLASHAPIYRRAYVFVDAETGEPLGLYTAP